MTHSLFQKKINPFDDFNFEEFDRLFAENGLLQQLGQEGREGKKITSIRDFFQDNYFPTQINTFFWGMDHVPDELNFAWLSHLHALAIKKLKNESGVDIPHVVRQEATVLEFPNAFLQLSIGAMEKASAEGISALGQELSDKEDIETKGDMVLLLNTTDSSNLNKSYSYQMLDSTTASEYYKKQQELFNAHKTELVALCRQFKINPATIFSYGHFEKLPKEMKENVVKLVKELSQSGHLPFFKNVGYGLINRNPFYIRKKAERLLEQYNKNSKKNEDEKLDAIIRLVKGLLNLHVWPDGNGRLCGFHLLNILLMKNGFPNLSFMDNGSIDAYTHEELKSKIQLAMLAFSKAKTKKGSTLEKFRNEQGYFSEEMSQVTHVILQNHMDLLEKTLKDKSIALSYQDLTMFADCKGTDFNWFLPRFDQEMIQIEDQSLSLDDFIKQMVTAALNSANEELLISIIQFVMKEYDKEKEEFTTILDITSILNFATYKIFNTLKPFLDHLDAFRDFGLREELFFKILCNAHDENVALESLDSCKNYLRGNYTFYDDDIVGFQDIIRYQKPSVIEKFFNFLKENKEFNMDEINVNDFNICDAIYQRYDLSSEQKKSLFLLLIPSIPFVEENVLGDFKEESLKFRKI